VSVKLRVRPVDPLTPSVKIVDAAGHPSALFIRQWGNLREATVETLGLRKLLDALESDESGELGDVARLSVENVFAAKNTFPDLYDTFGQRYASVAIGQLPADARVGTFHAEVGAAIGGGISSWYDIPDPPPTATRWPAFSEVTGTVGASQLPGNVALLDRTALQSWIGPHLFGADVKLGAGAFDSFDRHIASVAFGALPADARVGTIHAEIGAALGGGVSSWNDLQDRPATFPPSPHFHDERYLRLDTSNWITQTNRFLSYGGGSGTDSHRLEAHGEAGSDAFMAFHTAGQWAINFGLDRATNDLFVGGWSFGANKYRMVHTGNYPATTDNRYLRLVGGTVAGALRTRIGHTLQVASDGAADYTNQINVTANVDAWGLVIGHNAAGIAPSAYHQPLGAHIVNVGNAPLMLGTNNASRITIMGNGNVGIGTTFAESRLHVDGITRMIGAVLIQGQQNPSAGITGYLYGDAGGFGILHSAGGYGVRVTPTVTQLYGNVGIGTASPTRPLAVSAASNPYMSFSNDANEKWVLGGPDPSFGPESFIVWRSGIGYQLAVGADGHIRNRFGHSLSPIVIGPSAPADAMPGTIWVQ